MDGHEETVLLALTREEALDVFARCLRSTEEDTPESAEILRKLARALESFRVAA